MITNRLFGHLNKFNIGYILGEILLIFIGISLSFYFDEWRTNRQNRIKEKEILAEILIAVKKDTSTMRIREQLNDMASNKMSYLLDSSRLQTNPNQKTLECFGYLNFYHQFNSDLSAYNNLKSQGIDLISNQKLRISMIRYYEQMDEQSGWTNNISEVHFRQHLLPYIIDEFSDYLRGEKAIPENFESLKNNKRFWKIVKRTKMFYDLTAGQLKGRRELANTFLGELETELNAD